MGASIGRRADGKVLTVGASCISTSEVKSKDGGEACRYPG